MFQHVSTRKAIYGLWMVSCPFLHLWFPDFVADLPPDFWTFGPCGGWRHGPCGGVVVGLVVGYGQQYYPGGADIFDKPWWVDWKHHPDILYGRFDVFHTVYVCFLFFVMFTLFVRFVHFRDHTNHLFELGNMLGLWDIILNNSGQDKGNEGKKGRTRTVEVNRGCGPGRSKKTDGDHLKIYLYRQNCLAVSEKTMALKNEETQYWKHCKIHNRLQNRRYIPWMKFHQVLGSSLKKKGSFLCLQWPHHGLPGWCYLSASAELEKHDVLYVKEHVIAYQFAIEQLYMYV